MHWLLDVHYGEDYCRIANKTAQQNLNALRKFALSLIKRYKAQTNSKRPLSQIMLDCLLELDLLCAVLENCRFITVRAIGQVTVFPGRLF